MKNDSEKAIEIDPEYEPALLNLEIVKSLEEGRSLSAKAATI